MNRTIVALIVSVMVNVGVVAALAYSAFQHGTWPAVFRGDKGEPDLPAYLDLNAEQKRRWSELEAAFLRELGKDWRQIRIHRERMINEIFSEQPDRQRIEGERAAIAQLQSAQQRRVIQQLLEERDILDAAQRRKLAEMLLRQAPAGTFEERLHGK